eukprot:snap_masked-scaffold_9-processed-gene-6.44-mRNA-1 protein AED:1.00 eAED:1.00 QI:0/0/0/0/1/1/3/0/111
MAPKKKRISHMDKLISSIISEGNFSYLICEQAINEATKNIKSKDTKLFLDICVKRIIELLLNQRHISLGNKSKEVTNILQLLINLQFLDLTENKNISALANIVIYNFICRE